MEKQQGNRIRCGLSGAAAGLATGLFGGGGGMVLVPLLMRFCGLKEKESFAASVAAILPVCAVSAAMYWQRCDLPVLEALPYMAGGLLGGILGAKWFKRVSPQLLRSGMSLVLIYGGIRCLMF